MHTTPTVPSTAARRHRPATAGRYLALPLLLAALCASASPAGAATPAPRLTLRSYASPASFSPQDSARCETGLIETLPACDSYQMTITNIGSLPTEEVPISFEDTLPAGLIVTRVQLFLPGDQQDRGSRRCEPEGSVVHCILTPAQSVIAPDGAIKIIINFTVEEGATSGTNVASVSGGGAPAAKTSEGEILNTSTPFGINLFTSPALGLDGSPDVQAGDHPNELETAIDLNTTFRAGPEGGVVATSVQDVKDIVVDLPLGFLGSALATPQCTFAQLDSIQGCPLATQVGRILSEPKTAVSLYNTPIYNMVPEHGYPAEFGFQDISGNVHALYASVVPTPEGYVLRTTSPEITQINLLDVVATFYGDPAERQAEIRQLKTERELREAGVEHPHVEREHVNSPTAFFTNPSDCTGKPLVTTVHMDSWQEPGAVNPDGTPDFSDPRWVSASTQNPPVTGCNLLRFEPEAFAVQPETTSADAATGLTFDLKLPQPENPSTLATPPLRDATVTLPAGLIVNPASAAGLGSCTEAQIGWDGGSLNDFNAAQPACPDASKIGSVSLTTPLLSGTLTGEVYLAAQNENPYHSLLGGYIVVDDKATGTLVKIAGRLETNPSTGQITGVFTENPQLPFSDLKLHFFGGVRGELATPESCGTFTTTSSLIPWSSEEQEGHQTQEATPSSAFAINQGCTPGFTPAFTAGTTNPQAAGYSPFVLTFSRGDNEQELSGLTVTLPPGLTGKLAGITQCTDAELAAASANPSGAAEQSNPSCPANSRIGSVQSSAGVGSQPYTLGGTAYLTGPYKGAPYGIAVVVPALAGPFDLGNVVVRSKLNIDPNDAHVTVTSDPFPTIIDAKGADNHTDGFPIRLRSIQVTMDRPSFTLNPTSCEPQSITGTLTSTSNTPAALSSHFQAANCATLPFTPVFSASTDGNTSRALGASFHVKIGFPTGGQANIHKVELTIPSVLPSRLTTLQKACREAVFNANPASCPPESLIATATAHTPLLPDPLTGPVYFVSHGGAAFPDTVILLQGDNVKLIVTGHTDIKKGVTYSRFETVPDAPVTSFEFNAPEGPYSIFGSNGNLCQVEVRMPTRITAQNGVVFAQSTLVEPEGCPNKLTILAHTVKKRTLTLKVAIPGAGKLTASGKHLTKVSKTAGGRGIITLTLKATGHGKVNTKVNLTFAPAKGKHLAATLSARFKR